MVKLTGPILGTQASGGLGKTLIFSKSAGTSYVKRWAAPANPNTPPQISVRALVAFLSERWPQVSQLYRETWYELADRNRVSPLNACIAYNVPRWQRFQYPLTTLDPILPQVNATWDTYVVTVHNRSITIALHCNATNSSTGWPIHRVPSPYPANTNQNLVRIMPMPLGAGTTTWTDTPGAGTYKYRARLINAAGEVTINWGKGPFTVT